MRYLLSAEEMHDEPIMLIHVISTVDTRFIVWVACMPDGIDTQSSRLQDLPNFRRQKF